MAKLKTLAERTRDNDWPAPATFKNPEECAAAYDSGYEGCFADPEGAEAVEAQAYGKFSDVVNEFGIADSGKGKLSLLYPLCGKYRSVMIGFMVLCRSQPATVSAEVKAMPQLLHLPVL